MAQAASPKSFSPTMRELPLSVWNARRKVVCSLRLPGSSIKACDGRGAIDHYLPCLFQEHFQKLVFDSQLLFDCELDGRWRR